MEDIAKSLLLMLDRGLIDIERSKVLYLQAFAVWINDHQHLHEMEDEVN